MGRISGPLLDRIDLQVEVTPVAIGEISQVRPSEPSAAIRERVIRAREVQAERFRGMPGVHTNAMMNARMLREFCPLDQAARELLERAMVRLDLSARAYDRIVKVARTIADLEGTADIGAAHLAEAINYRSLDRGSWGRYSNGDVAMQKWKPASTDGFILQGIALGAAVGLVRRTVLARPPGGCAVLL